MIICENFAEIFIFMNCKFFRRRIYIGTADKRQKLAKDEVFCNIKIQNNNRRRQS
jgi:hypothetical protein